MVGEGQLNGVESLQLTPWGEVWAGSWTAGGASRWTRYDGTSWTPIDRPDYDGVDAIAWDPTGGIVATSRPEILRYNGSDWQSLLRLDDDAQRGRLGGGRRSVRGWDGVGHHRRGRAMFPAAVG